MTPTDDKPMTVEALIALAYSSVGSAHELRAAIEQYGREQYARGVNDAYAWPAGRGSGEPIAMLHDDGHWTHPPGYDPLDRFSGKVRMDVYAAPQPSETPTEAQECAAVVFATKMHVERRTNAHADICDDMGEVYATCSWSLDAGLRAEALRDLVNEAIERAHNIRSAG